MKTLYLAHNFNKRKTTRKWELRLEGKYKLKLDNPFYDNPNRLDDITQIDSFKDGSDEQRRFLSTRDARSIVEDDLEKIRKSDGILAIANETRLGTPMEIFFAAYVLRIPVYVITRRYSGHPWIRHFATEIFSSQRDFERYIEKIYGRKK